MTTNPGQPDTFAEFEALLVRERLFREDFERRLHAETLATIEERLRVHRLRSPVAYDDRARVLIHTNDGHRLLLDMRESFMSHHLIEHGEWEQPVRELIRRLLPVGGCFVDVGANIGVHSLFAASLVGPTGRVIALEPAPITCGILRENVEINGMLERITVVDKAVSDVTGLTMSFEYFPQHPAMSGFVVNNNRVDTLAATPETIQVSTVALDDLLSDANVSADLIKIDVEGFELDVLKGATKILETSPDTAFLIEHDYQGILALHGGDALRALWRLVDINGLLVFRVSDAVGTASLGWEEFAIARADLLLVHRESRPHRALSA